jgi:hypothetical protein
MRILTMKWFVCGVLVLGICLLASKGSFSADDDTEEKKAKDKAIADARAAVFEVVKGKGDPKDVAAKYSLEDVMHGFKPRINGGIGVGLTAGWGNIWLDGIELKINLIAAGQKMTEAQLKKQETDIINMLEVIKAIGEINKHYSEQAKKDPAKWQQYTEDMIQGAKDAQAAVKKGDPVEVKKTISKVQASCTACHGFWLAAPPPLFPKR